MVRPSPDAAAESGAAFVGGMRGPAALGAHGSPYDPDHTRRGA